MKTNILYESHLFFLRLFFISIQLIDYLNYFQISYLSSCPCLSDRHQFPNFFRTIPSDIYQARAIARLAIRFKWTWIGAVVANNDYGHMAVKVFHFVVEIEIEEKLWHTRKHIVILFNHLIFLLL